MERRKPRHKNQVSVKLLELLWAQSQFDSGGQLMAKLEQNHIILIGY